MSGARKSASFGRSVDHYSLTYRTAPPLPGETQVLQNLAVAPPLTVAPPLRTPAPGPGSSPWLSSLINISVTIDMLQLRVLVVKSEGFMGVVLF